MPTGLIRRNGRYSVRRVIPQDLQALYQRREIIRALGTADPKEARERHTLAWLELSREFNDVRTRIMAKGPADASAAAQSANSPEEIERKRAAHLAWQLGQFEAAEAEWNEPEEDYDPFKFRVAEAVEQRLALIAEEEAEARQIARAKKLSKETGETLFDVADKWAKEKSPSKKMVEITRKTVSDFYQIVGTIPVTAIRRSHVLTFKDSLVEKQEHPATANSRLARLRLLLGYALANAKIDVNPADKVKVASKQLAKEARTSYDAEALAAVFSSPVYANDLRPTAGGGEAAYWLPLLGLYTGARLNELGQLRPSDVIEESYIGDDNQELKAWVIRILEDEAAGLRLKTPGSRRRIPIHGELIRLGFLSYVTDAKARKQSKLFPLLKPDKWGTITGNWSKWYGRYLRSACGVTNKRIVFHSFRHSFKDNAKFSKIAAEVHNEITGHSSGDVADNYGGLSYPLHPLVEGMKLYRVPQFTPPLPPPAYRKSKP